MNNVWTLAFLAFVMGFLSNLSLSLGITTEWQLINRPEQPDALENTGAIEALLNIVNWVWSQVGSLIQLMSFQTSLPDVFSILFLVAGFMVLYMIIVIVRGGAG